MQPDKVHYPRARTFSSLLLLLYRVPTSIIFGAWDSAIFSAFTLKPLHEGAIGVFTHRTLSGRNLDCYFCSRYGNKLMHKANGEPNLVVKDGCLDNLVVSKAVHIWCKEAIVPIPEGVERFEEEPE